MKILFSHRYPYGAAPPRDLPSFARTGTEAAKEVKQVLNNGIWQAIPIWSRRRAAAKITAQKSSIEWTDATWNPVRGCVKISPGCKNCYAERFQGVKGHPYERGFDPRLVPEKLHAPLKWSESEKNLRELDERSVSRRHSGRIIRYRRLKKTGLPFNSLAMISFSRMIRTSSVSSTPGYCIIQVYSKHFTRL